MDKSVLDKVTALRRELHELAERSGEEIRTKARLLKFLRENTGLRLEDGGKWLLGAHTEPGAEETVAFRADMDALPVPDGARHLCGHDGHCAVLAGLGLLLEGRRLGRNILLMFQPAEETGGGGEACAEALEKLGAGRVYAFHSVPGYPEGTVLLRRGTFACASRGMTVALTGRPSHAAYPEGGRNPGFAAARLISALPELADSVASGGAAMATLIGARIGERAFGTAAGRAEIWLTLRTLRDGDMEKLIAAVREAALREAARGGVGAEFSFCDVFPATVNDDWALGRLRESCLAGGLAFAEADEPFRWSEDFGHYGRRMRAAMAGIGAGKDCPQLHTESFEFNDAVIPAALKLFSALAERG